MTAGEHSCTRRALLGAALGVPVVGSVCAGLPSPSRPLDGPLPLPETGEGEEGAWAAALADVVRAEAELRVVERGTKGLSFEAAEAVQEAYDARCDAWEEAIGRAFAVPAPDVAALAAKVVWAVKGSQRGAFF